MIRGIKQVNTFMCHTHVYYLNKAFRNGNSDKFIYRVDKCVLDWSTDPQII